jgi:hypothetical protein
MFMSKVIELTAKASTLPEDLAAEVLDFLEFVATKHSQHLPKPNPDVVTRFRGFFRGQLSSSTEFAARKIDEIRMEG